jgi:hypothetical protein
MRDSLINHVTNCLTCFTLVLVNLLLGFGGKYYLFFVSFGLFYLGFDSGIFTSSRSSSSTSILLRIVLLLIL